jgi:hypothetical protein
VIIQRLSKCLAMTLVRTIFPRREISQGNRVIPTSQLASTGRVVGEPDSSAFRPNNAT